MSKYLVQADWDDAPHLTEEQKKSLWDSIPPYQRDARTKGIPQLGSGAIYPISEADLIVDPFQIPLWYKRVFAMDVGWNRTAALWGAIDPETNILYLYAEHYRAQAEPAIHAAAVLAKGKWIPGVIDPAARGRQQSDGEQLLVTYQQLGLTLSLADNSVESGLYAVWMLMSVGNLRVFRGACPNWLAEYRIYRRDEKGKVVKENDHLMDCTRYMVMSGIAVAIPDPDGPRKFFGRDNTGMKAEYKPYSDMMRPNLDSGPLHSYDWKP